MKCMIKFLDQIQNHERTIISMVPTNYTINSEINELTIIYKLLHQQQNQFLDIYMAY